MFEPIPHSLNPPRYTIYNWTFAVSLQASKSPSSIGTYLLIPIPVDLPVVSLPHGYLLPPFLFPSSQLGPLLNFHLHRLSLPTFLSISTFSSVISFYSVLFLSIYFVNQLPFHKRFL